MLITLLMLNPYALTINILDNIFVFSIKIVYYYH